MQKSFYELLEDRRLMAAITLNPNSVYQTIQGWGTAGVYPTNLVTVAQAGNIMRDAGMNVLRVTPGPNDYAYTVGGNMRTPVPISANLAENVARFNPNSNNQTDILNWLKVNGLEPERTKMIGALWSPPHWMKITTGRLINWDNNGPQSGYDPIIPWGDYGGNTGAGRVNPTMWTDWARYVLSTVKSWEQKTGLPMYAFSFQNEPNVPTSYNSATFTDIANDVNNPSAGFTSGHWDIYGDAVQALTTELALHPEMTTKFFGPELSQLGGGASNPYNLPSYNAIRQNLISRGLLGTLGAYATHEYTYPADSASMWDAWYNGSQHTAQIINGTNNLGWLGPTPGIAGDNKEIWQTETEGEDQTWTKDGAMGFGLKIFNSLVYGNVSGYTSWTLTGYDSNDSWGVVDLDDINNPTNSYKFDAFKHFSRWIRPGAQRINATFANGKASTGGANELDSYNGLNIAAFKHTQDQRLTMVLVNMKTAAESTTITIPAGMSISSLQVYQTSGTQKYVQLADLTPVNGQITLTVPASSFVTVTGTYTTTATVPAPWTYADIGSPSPAGSSVYTSATDTFTVAGGGADIWGNSDQFHYLSQNVTGNATIIARVTSVQNTNTWAKAGVMFRETTAANAMFANVVVTPSSGVSFQWRNSTGGNCGFAQTTGITAPAWVKLVRSGNNFTAFYSTSTSTPTTWIAVGTPQTVAMNTSAQIGLAVTSHNNGTLSTSTFTGVQITQANQAPTVATAALGTPNPVTATTTSLSVLGADDNGEPGLTYTWATTGMPPNPVTFSANGTNAAKNTTATFTQAGTYNFQVTITDAGGLSTTSTVTVTVNSTGMITGQAYQDRNGNGTFDVGEPILNGATVYIDANNNSSFDSGESISITSGSGNYQFSNLVAGNYVVRQIVPSNYVSTAVAGTVTVGLNSTQSGKNFGNFPTLINGTISNDNYSLRIGGTNVEVWLNGFLTHTIAQSLITGLTINGLSGSDTLDVQGAGNSDPINISSAGTISRNGKSFTYSGVESVQLQSANYAISANLGSIGLVVNGATATLTQTQTLSSLALSNSASVTSASTNNLAPAMNIGAVTISNSILQIAPNGGMSGVSKFSSIAITGTGKLDLHNNDLVIDYGNSSTTFPNISNLIKSGLVTLGGNGNGITSTEVDNQTIPGAMLAVVDAGDPNINGAITSLSGYTIPNPSTSVLVKYTWFGDANFDGLVDGADYALTDTGYTSTGVLTGWVFGDFDYSGEVNDGDYALQDTGFIAQNIIL